MIGARVRQARKTAKPPITQLDLVARLESMGIAKRMKIDQSIISKIESGQRQVYDYELIALAKVLNVSILWLLGETNDK